MLGILEGANAKLGPLAKRDSCALVKLVFGQVYDPLIIVTIVIVAIFIACLIVVSYTLCLVVGTQPIVVVSTCCAICAAIMIVLLTKELSFLTCSFSPVSF